VIRSNLNMTTIPQCNEDVTVEYLNSVLKDFRQIEKVSFSTPKTHGGMSNVSKAVLQYKEDNDNSHSKYCPVSIFVKYSSTSGANFLNTNDTDDIMRHGKLYDREIMMYNFLKGTTLIPQPYYTNIDGDQNFIMLLEDVSLLNDIKSGEENIVQKVLPLEKVKIAITDLANFQSQFYHENNPNRFNGTKGIVHGNNDQLFNDKQLSWLPETFHFLYYTTYHKEFHACTDKDNFGSYNIENLKRIADDCALNWDAAVKFMLTLDLESLNTSECNFDLRAKLIVMKESNIPINERFYNAFKYLSEKALVTLVHHDFRADNMCFVDGKMKLFDWQCASIGSGLLDVASLFHQSMSPSEFYFHEDELLKNYYQVIHEHNKFYSFDDMKNDYRNALWYELKLLLMFAKSIEHLPKDFKTIGVSYTSLMEMFLRRITSLIYAVHNHCYI